MRNSRRFPPSLAGCPLADCPLASHVPAAPTHRWSLAALSMVCILVLLGCERERPRSRVMPADESKMAIDANQDHLILALEFLDDFHKYAENEIVPRIKYHLNEWGRTKRAADDWIADPLFQRLPSRLGISDRASLLSELKFIDADVVMLREARWIVEVSRQVAEQSNRTSPYAELVIQTAKALSPTETRDLRFAVESFDWSVRNVQLESGQHALDLAEAAGADAPRNGGFRTSWESLLVARGDVLARARIVILLARQLNVPIVMLGIEPTDETDPIPWALAAMVGKQLYLFDPRLGLPIRTADGQRIATLQEVIEAPEILSALSVDGQRYPIRAEQLGRVVAMADATVPYLSQRMYLLERALTGDNKMKLTTSPTSLAKELRRGPGIAGVQIWPYAYDVIRYRQSQMNNPRFIAQVVATSIPFAGDNALANGRRLHFAGKYRNDPPHKGAIAYYLDCRFPETTIQKPFFNEALCTALGLQPSSLPKEPSQQQAFYVAQIARMRFFKQNASFWLGLIELEKGKFAVAEDYFKTRVLKAFPAGANADGARYLLARTYEGWGRRDKDPALLRKAIEIYENDKSPQAAGNQLRGNWLRTLADELKAPRKPSKPASPTPE